MLTKDKINKINDLYNAGKNAGQISTLMRVSKNSVLRYIKSNNKSQKTEERDMITTDKYAVNALVENKYDPSIATDTIIHLHLIGKNIDEIASEAHVDKATAENYIKVYESSKTLILPRRGNRVVTEPVYDKMIRMYTGEATIDTIAKSLNVSEPLVGRYIISYKTYMTGGNHKPAKRKNAKINLTELVELKQAGFTTSEMAAYFDVAEGSINERLLEAKRNGMFIDVKKAKTVKNNTTTTTSNSEKESSTELTQSQSQKPVAPTLETAEPSTLETTDSHTTSLEFTVIGDKAMEMVDKLMKFKDSTVTIKDIAELSSLIESATIRKYKLTKK